MTDIKLEKEQKDKAIRDIQWYFEKEREEEIGNLGAELILDFFLKEIAPTIYNEGLTDAKAWFTSKLADLDIDFMILEKDVI